MSKLDIYKKNNENHEKLILEKQKIIEIRKSNFTNCIYIQTLNTDVLSDRFLDSLSTAINSNLLILLFQSLRLSSSLLEIDKKEAIKEAKNFINSCEEKHG